MGPLAVDAALRGAELQPSWANGAKNFVEGVSAEQFWQFRLCNRHSIIRHQDEDAYRFVAPRRASIKPAWVNRNAHHL